MKLFPSLFSLSLYLSISSDISWTTIWFSSKYDQSKNRNNLATQVSLVPISPPGAPPNCTASLVWIWPIAFRDSNRRKPQLHVARRRRRRQKKIKKTTSDALIDYGSGGKGGRGPGGNSRFEILLKVKIRKSNYMAPPPPPVYVYIANSPWIYSWSHTYTYIQQLEGSVCKETDRIFTACVHVSFNRDIRVFEFAKGESKYLAIVVGGSRAPPLCLIHQRLLVIWTRGFLLLSAKREKREKEKEKKKECALPG